MTHFSMVNDTSSQYIVIYTKTLHGNITHNLPQNHPMTVSASAHLNTLTELFSQCLIEIYIVIIY